MAGLIAKASKVYRIAEFDKLFTKICSISPTIGRYLHDADENRCHFPGFRYDIRTTNPAESINA
ncbi:hypothetical protein, partial [Escherichia coli]|uniref:hypothetical protein n=1 Tax=Escherichia coli TaxID=562 RepID=UPI001C5A579F